MVLMVRMVANRKRVCPSITNGEVMRYLSYDVKKQKQKRRRFTLKVDLRNYDF